MVSGMELNKLQNATVKIYPDYSKATMSLTDGTVTTDNTNGVNASTGNAITLTTSLGMNSGSEITAGQDGHPNNLGTGTTEGYSAKTRAVVDAPADIDKDSAIALAKEAVSARLTGTIIKEIYVPGKLVNIVMK
mgnify:CR=1 FL=1